ncbi:MAG: hypothetical protein JNL70_18590 [Saprospiraceae bacterium]|nr:hypothetical protein [Saprospiraceae bacterium]
MKIYSKSLFTTILTLSSLFLLSDCKKDEDVITYELTLTATKSANGSTNFAEIKYADGSKVVQTITNSTTNFSTTFAITANSVISFSVKGTASGGSTAALPTPLIGYKVEKITNGTVREAVCNEFAASLNGSNGSYSFEKAFTKSFDGSTCN